MFLGVSGIPVPQGGPASLWLLGQHSSLDPENGDTVKILKFGTPQTIAIIILKLVKFDVTLH